MTDFDVADAKDAIKFLKTLNRLNTINNSIFRLSDRIKTDQVEKTIDVINKLTSDVNKYKKETEKMRDKITTYQEELTTTNDKLSKTTIATELYKTEIDKYAREKQTISNIGISFKKKLIFTKLFLNVLCNYADKAGIDKNFTALIGSFTRQIFELPYALSEYFSTSGFANPQGHDLDFVLCNYHQLDNAAKQQIVLSIKRIYDDLSLYITLNAVDTGKFENYIKFGDYKLIKISDVTIKKAEETDTPGRKLLLDIPHLVLYFVDERNVQLKVDLLGWPSPNVAEWNSSDFDVNKLSISNYGVTVNNGNFINILHSIEQKQALCCTDLYYLHQLGWQQVLRTDKLPYLMQIAFFFMARAKIISGGYQIVSDKPIPEFKLETAEECPITRCEAPYINIKLLCGHYISTMAYAGILKRGISEITQSLPCPHCRADLKLVFHCKPAKIIKYSSFMEKIHLLLKEKEVDCGIVEEKQGTQLYNDDCYDFIQDLQSTPIMQADANAAFNVSADNDAIVNRQNTRRAPSNREVGYGTL